MLSLDTVDSTYFESIYLKTASQNDYKKSLYNLSNFLTEKFHQKVIVLIDEYEVPNNHAYDYGYFSKVHSIYPSL